MKTTIVGLLGVGALAAFLTGCAAFDYPSSMNMSSSAPMQMVACSGGTRNESSGFGSGAIPMASLVDTIPWRTGP